MKQMLTVVNKRATHQPSINMLMGKETLKKEV